MLRSFWDVRCPFCGSLEVTHRKKGGRDYNYCNDCHKHSQYVPHMAEIYRKAALIRMRREENPPNAKKAVLEERLTRPRPEEIGLERWQDVSLDNVLPGGKSWVYEPYGIFTLGDYYRDVVRGKKRVPRFYHRFLLRVIHDAMRMSHGQEDKKGGQKPRRNASRGRNCGQRRQNGRCKPKFTASNGQNCPADGRIGGRRTAKAG